MNNRYADGVVTPAAKTARAAIAQELKSTRQELHITQDALAERAGTQKSNISRMESGRYNPSLDFLVKVAESMGKKLEIHIN